MLYMRFKRTSIVFFLCSIFASASFAQTVTGKIVDSVNVPVPFATIALIKARDSLSVKGNFSNDKGEYIFENISPGNYFIKAVSVGYKDAFLIEEIILCGITGTPPNKEIEKTALGATSTVKWNYFKTTLEALEHLKLRNYRPFTVEQASKSIPFNKFTLYDEKIALIFGNEVYGVDQDVIDACNGVIEIPQLGTKHSLNISVSIGVVLREFYNHSI